MKVLQLFWLDIETDTTLSFILIPGDFQYDEK